MPEKGYNGWTNYETWAVNLWIDNDGMDEEVRERVSGLDEYRAGKAIQEMIEELNPLADEASMFSDLLSGALSEVNWQEIAEHYLEEEE